MTEVTSQFLAWKSSLVTSLLITAGLMGFLVNLFYIFATCRSKFLKKPHNLFLLSLAICDILGVVLWTIPSIVASATWKWHFGSHLCNLHGFIAMFCFSLNMITFLFIAVEKFFKLVIPAKHRYAFQNYTIVVIVISSLWIYGMVMSFMPLIGWSDFKFYNYQMQCVADFVLGESLLSFFVTVSFVVPSVITLALYIIIFVKVRSLNEKQHTKEGKLILQEQKDAPGDSYAEQIKLQNSKFKLNKSLGFSKNASEKKSKAKQDKKKKNTSDKCFHSDDSEVEVSDEEYFQDYEDYHNAKRDKKRLQDRQRIFLYKKHHFYMALTMAVTNIIFIALWAPFYIIHFFWLYDPDSVYESSFLICSTASFFGLSYKPLIYFTNKQVRGSYAQTFKCKMKKKAPYGGIIKI